MAGAWSVLASDGVGTACVPSPATCGWSWAGEDLRGGTADDLGLVGVPHRLGGDRKLCLVRRGRLACGDRHAGELSGDDDRLGLRQAEPLAREGELAQCDAVFRITWATHQNLQMRAIGGRGALAAAMCRGRPASGLGAAWACGV